jgi:hypothetical protein
MYTCLSKLGIETARATCQNTIRLHRGYSNGRNVLRKMSQSFWCSYYCIFSYIAIIFFFKSSQVLQLIPLLEADLDAREYSVLYNVVIFPRRGPRIYIKHYVVYIRRDKCVESCYTHRLRKIQCILTCIYNYRTLHSLDKIIWNVEKTFRDILSHVSI